MPSEAVKQMKVYEASSDSLFIIHPIEGHVNHLQQLAKSLNANVYGLQCTAEAPLMSIAELAEHYIKVSVITLLLLILAQKLNISVNLEWKCRTS